MMVNDAAVVTW